jgi:hypothetical protein
MSHSASRLRLNVYNQAKVQVWQAAATELASSPDAIDPFVEASLHAVLAWLRLEAGTSLVLLDLFGRQVGPLGSQLHLIATFLPGPSETPDTNKARRCWTILKAAYYTRWLEFAAEPAKHLPSVPTEGAR